MSFLWIKFKNNQAVEVPTENCRNISSFIEACMKKLPRLLGSFDSAQLFLSTTVDGSSPLDPGDPIPATPNTSKTPLYIHVIQQEMLSNIFTQVLNSESSPPSLKYLEACIEKLEATLKSKLSESVRNLLTTHSKLQLDLCDVVKYNDKEGMKNLVQFANTYIKSATRRKIETSHGYNFINVISHADQEENIIFQVTDVQWEKYCGKVGKCSKMQAEWEVCNLVKGPCVMPGITFIEVDEQRGALITPRYPNPVAFFVQSKNENPEYKIVLTLLCGLSAIKSFNDKGKHHCDIKPSNMMVDNDGMIVLIDFGSVADTGALLSSCTPGMSIRRGNPSLGFDLSCLVTTVMQLMFRNYDKYRTMEHVQQQIGIMKSVYPTLCEMLLKLPIDQEVNADEFVVVSRELFELGVGIMPESDLHLLTRADIFTLKD